MVTNTRQRDAFLSHRFTDKEFVRRLAADIETKQYGDRSLTVWIDEAEIRPGQSIPGMINAGLEQSRFIILVMTAAYFESDSGWTDAEWHAALHADPDNRKGRIIPIIAGDCPYIPMLLRHFLSLDLRGRNYYQDLHRLIAILRDEPLPRPITHRGQLIRSNGRIDRMTLVAERAVPEGDPDPVDESLSCNLLPIERPPLYLYEGKVHPDLLIRDGEGKLKSPSKSTLIARIRAAQVEAGNDKPRTPAFRLVGNKIVTFHDLESDESLFAPIVDQSSILPVRVSEAIQDEDDRLVIISLMNMSLSRHLMGRCLLVESKRGNRFYFPAKNGQAHQISWKPLRKMTKRTVTKPYKKGETQYWLHQAAYIKVVFLGSRFYLQLTPTWMLTEDGENVKGGLEVGGIVNRWAGRERNLSIIYHVRFWTSVLRKNPGSLISIRAGEQTIDVSTIPAFVSLPYGIASDKMDILAALDEEAPRIALAEECLEVEALEEESEDEESVEMVSDVDEGVDE